MNQYKKDTLSERMREWKDRIMKWINNEKLNKRTNKWTIII